MKDLIHLIVHIGENPVRDQSPRSGVHTTINMLLIVLSPIYGALIPFTVDEIPSDLLHSYAYSSRRPVYWKIYP